MNFKIEQTYPTPTQGITPHNILTYANKINSLILYGEQKPIAQATVQQPKKKIAFKVDKSAPAPANDKISIFDIGERKWEVIQAKGKIPSSRTDFKSIYMEPCMIVYGGKVNNKVTNEVYALNCENWVWKKLFSLDGPPSSQQNFFFKISETMAGLIVSNSLWLLQVSDVKWELAANELPGSVWIKVNINLPQNVKFCWAINPQILLIVGKNTTIKVDIQTKQKLSQFQFDYEKYIKSSADLSQNKLINIFYDTLQSQRYPDNKISLSYLVFQHAVYILKYSAISQDCIQILSEEYAKIPIKRPIKCSSYISQPSTPSTIQTHSSSSYKQIFYIDTKGELLSINLSIQIPELQTSTARILQSPDRPETILRNNSCILQEEENEQSSIFVASSNSRVKISENNSKSLKNNQREYEEQDEEENEYEQGVGYEKDYKDLENEDQKNCTQIMSSQKIINTKKTASINPNDRHNNLAQSYSEAYRKEQKQKYRQTQDNSRVKCQQNESYHIPQTIKQKIPQHPSKKVSTPSNHPTQYIHTSSFTNPNHLDNSHRIQSNERFKYKTEQHNDYKIKTIQSPLLSHHHKKQSYQSPRNDEEEHQLQLQEKLQNILYNQTVKRKLLQSKVQALQNIIIKSQKFVLQLCKYGNVGQRKKHIERVKKIREQIEQNWKKQNYYRKQMQGNRLPNQINQQIIETMSHIEY